MRRRDIVAALRAAGSEARAVDLPDAATQRVRHQARALLAGQTVTPPAGWGWPRLARPLLLGGLAAAAILAFVLNPDPEPGSVKVAAAPAPLVTDGMLAAAITGVAGDVRRFRERYGMAPQARGISPADALREEIAAVASQLRDESI